MHRNPLSGAVLVMLLVTAIAACALARPADPWPGPAGDYLFIEAEEMTLQGDGWAIEQPTRNLDAGVPSNLKLLAGDRAGMGEAVQAMAVHAEGTYRLWVRFNQQLFHDAKKRGAFQITIAQEGKELLAHVFDETYDGPEGSVRDPAKWVWQSASADLKRGPATLTLGKSGAAKCPHGARQIDCCLLTTDTAYVPNERDFAPQTYLRIRLAQADPEKVYFYAWVDHFHAPWGRNISMATGVLNWDQGLARKGQKLLSAGESSGWLNLTRALYADSGASIMLQATTSYRTPGAASSRYAVDFAAEPRDGAIVASFERNGPGGGMSVRLPPDLLGSRKPVFDLEVAADNLRLAERLPVPAFGAPPKKFPVLVSSVIDDSNASAGAGEREIKVQRILGFNGATNAVSAAHVAAGMVFGRAGARVWALGPGGYDEPLLDRIHGYVDVSGRQLAADPLKDHYIATKMMDEATAPALEELAGQPAHEAAFVKWLREQGSQPKDLGAADWDAVHLTADRDGPNPMLYLQSQRFRAWSIAHFFKQATAIVHETYPPGALATQNFSDGAVYTANLYDQGCDYFTWFRNQAMDLAWSEDWTNGGSTPQLCGWNVALLRAATREHHQPIGMYVVSSLRPPLDGKLKAYSELAQGVKILNISSYMPTYHGHEISFYMNAPIYAATAELTHEIGAAEDVLLDAQPRRAQTAIIYSRAYDIWNVKQDNIEGEERMHTWLALRHAQVAVDVLDEEDVIAEQLKDRRVAYLFGEQLDRRAMEKLSQWVLDGGVLVLACGAGGRDELNQPDPTLDRTLGLVRQPLQRLQKYWRYSRALGTQDLKAKGAVQLPAAGQHPPHGVEYVALRQDLTPQANDLIGGTFADDKAAAVSHAAGKGRVYAMGFLPAVSYIRGALQIQLAHPNETATPLACVTGAAAIQAGAGANLPADVSRSDYSWAPPKSSFDYALRDFIASPVRMAGVEQPVEADSALVEATLLEGAVGWVAPLANYTGAALDRLTVTLRIGNKPFAEVRSARQGVLKAELISPGMIRVTLPLESTDMVYAKWVGGGDKHSP